MVGVGRVDSRLHGNDGGIIRGETGGMIRGNDRGMTGGLDAWIPVFTGMTGGEDGYSCSPVGV